MLAFREHAALFGKLLAQAVGLGAHALELDQQLALVRCTGHHRAEVQARSFGGQLAQLGHAHAGAVHGLLEIVESSFELGTSRRHLSFRIEGAAGQRKVGKPARGKSAQS